MRGMLKSQYPTDTQWFPDIDILYIILQYDVSDATLSAA